MNKILIRFCAAALSLVCFCSSGVFAMLNISEGLSIPQEPLRYNDRLVNRKGYPYYIDKDNDFVRAQWDKFWWTREAAMRTGGIAFRNYEVFSRFYPLNPQIIIGAKESEDDRSDKWERVVKAFKESGDAVFYLFLEDYLNEFYKKDCLENRRFTSGCLWRILAKVNPHYVVEKLGEDWAEHINDTPITEADIDGCIYGVKKMFIPPCRPNTLDAVQFIAEGLYQMHFDNLIAFFSNLYAYFFKVRTRLIPEQIYIIYDCIGDLYYELIGSSEALQVHLSEMPEWFSSYQYHQLIELKKQCVPDSDMFKSRVPGFELKYLECAK